MAMTEMIPRMESAAHIVRSQGLGTKNVSRTSTMTKATPLTTDSLSICRSVRELKRAPRDLPSLEGGGGVS
jgi:hypothetical protein